MAEKRCITYSLPPSLTNAQLWNPKVGQAEPGCGEAQHHTRIDRDELRLQEQAEKEFNMKRHPHEAGQINPDFKAKYQKYVRDATSRNEHIEAWNADTLQATKVRLERDRPMHIPYRLLAFQSTTSILTLTSALTLTLT